MNVVVFTRSSSVARVLACTPICCSILQYTKRTKPSADTWAIDPWVRVEPSFLCAPLFQSVCVRVGDDVFLVATWNLAVIFTRYRMPLLGAFSCRPSVSPEPSAARMPLLILWLPPTQYTAVGRDIAHYSFSIIRAVVCGFSSNMRSKLVGLQRIILVFIRIFYATRTHAYSYDTYILVWYVVWSKTRMRCGLLYYILLVTYWGACWSKVLVLIWYHMYVRKDCCFWFFIEIFYFYGRYLVVGSRYDFCFGFYKKLKNVSCEYDLLNGWNPILQAAFQ